MIVSGASLPPAGHRVAPQPVPGGVTSGSASGRLSEDCPQPVESAVKSAIASSSAHPAQYRRTSIGYSKNETSPMVTSASQVPLGPAAIANVHPTPVILVGSID